MLAEAVDLFSRYVASEKDAGEETEIRMCGGWTEKGTK